LGQKSAFSGRKFSKPQTGWGGSKIVALLALEKTPKNAGDPKGWKRTYCLFQQGGEGFWENESRL